FPNDLYRLEVKEEKTGKTVSQTVFQSMWIDMPRSLLSLDFSTKMLHYIVSQETIDRLTEGNRAEREQKFRSFWKKKDPTPKTEYNELIDRKSTRLNSSHVSISYAVFCLKKKKIKNKKKKRKTEKKHKKEIRTTRHSKK